MGVVCVYAYAIPEGKSGQQVVDSLQKQMEVLGATKTGNFCVDCETYQSHAQNAQQRTIHILHNSEQPATCFSVLDSGNVLVSDILFDLIMNTMTQAKSGREGFFQQRKGFKIESRGQRYELADFVIKIGSVSLVSNFKGILIEVEYCPCQVPNDCWNLMKELLQSIVGNTADTLPAYVKAKMDSLYSPEDTINQYLEHFNAFRKSAVPGQQNR